LGIGREVSGENIEMRSEGQERESEEWQGGGGDGKREGGKGG